MQFYIFVIKISKIYRIDVILFEPSFLQWPVFGFASEMFHHSASFFRFGVSQTNAFWNLLDWPTIKLSKNKNRCSVF